MEFAVNILQLFLVVFVGRMILNSIFTKLAVKKQDDEILKQKSEMIEKEKEAVVIEMVHDPICGAYVPKSKAYQVVEEKETHYFCSWECREKYIQENR